MAKIYGLFGSMTGKLADTVMSVRNGEQIARKYQPVVFNPSTQAQIAQRAKLKLMSQLSAVMAPVIAIRKQGPVSSRNLFTKVNIRKATFGTDVASINLENVSLTNSVVSLPDVIANRDTSTGAITAVMSATPEGMSRIVYAFFVKQPDETLRLVSSQVVSSEPWSSAAVSAATTLEYVVYAYGIRDNTEAATTKFGSMEAITAEQVAKLIVTRTLTENDITLTETKATTVPVVSGREATNVPVVSGREETTVPVVSGRKVSGTSKK